MVALTLAVRMSTRPATAQPQAGEPLNRITPTAKHAATDGSCRLTDEIPTATTRIANPTGTAPPPSAAACDPKSRCEPGSAHTDRTP